MMDIAAARNAFGRQVHSFEADLDFGAVVEDGPVHAVFIRAPWVAEHGPGVEVLAAVDGHPVAVREGSMLALSFHRSWAGTTACTGCSSRASRARSADRRARSCSAPACGPGAGRGP
jgi:glutamine amidotransferase PdxT